MDEFREVKLGAYGEKAGDKAAVPTTARLVLLAMVAAVSATGVSLAMNWRLIGRLFSQLVARGTCPWCLRCWLCVGLCPPRPLGLIALKPAASQRSRWDVLTLEAPRMPQRC